jgi:hypothetical protein
MGVSTVDEGGSRDEHWQLVAEIALQDLRGLYHIHLKRRTAVVEGDPCLLNAHSFAQVTGIDSYKVHRRASNWQCTSKLRIYQTMDVSLTIHLPVSSAGFISFSNTT